VRQGSLNTAACDFRSTLGVAEHHQPALDIDQELENQAGSRWVEAGRSDHLADSLDRQDHHSRSDRQRD